MFRLGTRGVLRVERWGEWDGWLAHGFSTRATGDFLRWPSDSKIAAVFQAGRCGTAMLRQVHSGRWVRADAPWGQARPKADAVGSATPGVLMGVRTADCLPVLLVAPRSRAVAAVHAGWRGTVAGVLPRAVQGLTADLGARPGEIEAAVGPGIGTCCFEVGEEVASQFPDHCVADGCGRPHVDLAAALEGQLADCGVPTVMTARLCTHCDVERFFSHRAEAGRTGRMLSVVGLKPASRRSRQWSR
ncbi:MAG: peptidoglycan editing factor PgeF [Bryobacterales bacterium]|nr:peptidoglycan editing factor PgeF [Bryobacterales bacterium]